MGVMRTSLGSFTDILRMTGTDEVQLMYRRGTDKRLDSQPGKLPKQEKNSSFGQLHPQAAGHLKDEFDLQLVPGSQKIRSS